MENQNQTNPNLNTPSPEATKVPQPQMQPPQANISLPAKLSQIFNKFKSSPFMVGLSSKFAVFTPQQRRLFKITGGIFIFALVLIIIGSIVKSLRPQTPVASPTSTPTSSTPFPTTPPIGKPSIYATDSGVLKIESDIKDLGGKLEGTDLEESNLRPPDINFYVSFTE